MSIADRLIRNYMLARRQATFQGHDLSKGEYMIRAFPGRYNSKESAYQAYNKTVRGKRSGKRLEKASHVDTSYMSHGKRINPGGAELGYWQVTVLYNARDTDGNLVEDLEGSFLIASAEHKDVTSIPFIEEIGVQLADEKVDEWCESYGEYRDCEMQSLSVRHINFPQRPMMEIDHLYWNREGE